MTEIVFTPNGPKVANLKDEGGRFYRKNEVDAYIERMAKNRFKAVGWVWQYMGDIHVSDTLPVWAETRKEGDPIPFPVFLDREWKQRI